MTLANWLTVLLVGTLCGVTVLCLVLNHLERLRWMRIFSLKQGVPIESMEAKPVKEYVPAPDLRKKFSIPIPGNQMFTSKPK